VTATQLIHRRGRCRKLICLDDAPIKRRSEDLRKGGCLWVYGVGQNGVTAFTEGDIKCLHQIIADEPSRRPRTASGRTRQIVQPAVLKGCSRCAQTFIRRSYVPRCSCDRSIQVPRHDCNRKYIGLRNIPPHSHRTSKASGWFPQLEEVMREVYVPRICG
jgi:hypothetical protein